MHRKPYTPDIRDCKLIVRTPDAICYVIDTYCRTITPEQQRAAEQHLAHMYYLKAVKGDRQKSIVSAQQGQDSYPAGKVPARHHPAGGFPQALS